MWSEKKKKWIYICYAKEILHRIPAEMDSSFSLSVSYTLSSSISFQWNWRIVTGYWVLCDTVRKYEKLSN